VQRSFRVAEWLVDPATGRIRSGDTELKLEPKVMDVLVYLAERQGEVISREELESAVWAGTVVGYDAVTGSMLKLRKAFGDDRRNPRIIETLSKKGYRLIATVSNEVDPTPVVEQAVSNVTVPTTPARRRYWLVAVAVLGGIMLATFLLQYAQGPRPDIGDRRGPSIVVLPFENLGEDPKQQYFADGITDDLITDLTKVPGLFVISRDSAFAYRGERPELRTVSKELGVRYVLHGSVRRSGPQLRINAQLADTTTGKQLWAERYDSRFEDLFMVQDQINKKILTALSLKLSTTEQQRLARQDTSNLVAYEYFLRGEEYFYRYSRRDNLQARDFFNKAIASDPKFARAYAMVAWTHTFDFMNGWSDAPQQSLRDGEQLASRALELNADLPLAYFVRGLVHRERGYYGKARVEAEKAVAHDPNYANGHVLHATLLYYAGRPQDGLERMQKAARLNPYHPSNYPFHTGQAYFVLGQYQLAIDEFKKGLVTNPTSERLRVWLAAAYARSGKLPEAKWELEQVLTTNPSLSLSRISRAFPFKDPADLERFVGGLRLAGLDQ